MKMAAFFTRAGEQQILHMPHDHDEHLVSKICEAFAAGGKGEGLVASIVGWVGGRGVEHVQ